MAEQLISIREAAEQGVERLRRPIWADPLDHIKIDLFDKQHGPWAHFFSPFNEECNGRDPVNCLIFEGGLLNTLQISPSERIYVPYIGPDAQSAEYLAARAKFKGVLKEASNG